jgi:hypothetical protein
MEKYKSLSNIKLYDYHFDEHKKANDIFNKIRSDFPAVTIDVNSDNDDMNSESNYDSENEY